MGLVLKHGQPVRTIGNKVFLVRTILSDAMEAGEDPIAAALDAHRASRELAYLVDITPMRGLLKDGAAEMISDNALVTIEGRDYIISASGTIRKG